MVAKISAFTGRAIPVVGWIILASDVSQIAYRTVRDYNRIARGSDKIW
ncbi:S-adenosylmethionine:tRNA ribosyltransferase-isomerase [Salmonella enterica subsp. enterica serovar Manhattan str. 111113]|nr:S-adenosylmethionine:tRNA ribosyltransferase-isomerase [Salmonella enterica subsp. enterica serovar Manhattan str. 111113]